MTKIITYKVEDIFQDIEGDPDNVLMNIPPEISERMGWKEGDILKITVEDGKILISKKDDNAQE
jgi:AbrB family looped-hinge helix DNA binding protein